MTAAAPGGGFLTASGQDRVTSSLAAFDTFRDPAGHLRIEQDCAIRTVRPAYAADTLRFIHSSRTQQWMAAGRMVPTAVRAEQPGQTLLLEHELIAFPSYPWEWVPGQWATAASLTLDLCEESLEDGLILKDATPLNVLFRGAEPVFVDVLSFEPRDLESPLWMAYAQFVRTFLLPLAAYKYLGWPLSASLSRRDGYEPADLYPYLSAAKRWSSPLRSLVTLPRLLERRGPSATNVSTRKMHQPAAVAAQVLRGTLHSLRGAVDALTAKPAESRWSGYATHAPHYSGADHARKEAFVRQALSVATPAHVLDLGANTGRYSRLAAASGADVVAWDTDVSASEHSWREAHRHGHRILPLIADAARPTPAVGWRNRESTGLLERARGLFDCVMALGLLHTFCWWTDPASGHRRTVERVEHSLGDSGVGASQ